MTVHGIFDTRARQRRTSPIAKVDKVLNKPEVASPVPAKSAVLVTVRFQIYKVFTVFVPRSRINVTDDKLAVLEDTLDLPCLLYTSPSPRD